MSDDLFSGRNHGRQDGMDELLAGLSEGLPTGLAELHSLRRLMEGLGEDVKIEALARAIQLGNRKDDFATELRRRDRIEYLEDVGEAVGNFADGIGRAERGVARAATVTMSLVSPAHMTLRSSGVVPYGGIVRSCDSFVTELGSQIGVVYGLIEALKEFKQRFEDLQGTRTKGEAAINDETYERQLNDHVSGILGVIDVVTEHACNFPKWCHSIVDSVKDNDRRLREKYLTDRDSDEDKGPKSLFEMFNPQVEPEEVPIYKGNLYLTAYLHGLLKQAPEVGKDSNSAIHEVETVLFINSLAAHADPHLLVNLRTGTLFKTLADGISILSEIFKGIDSSTRASDLEGARDRNPERERVLYGRIMAEAKKTAPGHSGGDSRIADFIPTELVKFLKEFQPRIQRTEEEASGARATSEKEQVYLTIFAKLENMVDRLAHQGASVVTKQELIDFAAEIGELKASIREPEKRKVSAQLKIDKAEGNFAFTVDQEDHGTLTLRRVPTHRVQYNDVKGASWTGVQNRLEGLLRYGELGYVYSHLSARGKANNNMLIVGPYGCGKNMFLKALMSDPRTIGVNMTTDRVQSMWHGQSESNVRRLFETAHQKRVEHDRPVVIGWDEFDSLYSDRSGRTAVVTSNIDIKMQKILQSVLDGDTIYDGVSLIGLTNEPLKIPVPIYRRFAHVEIIQPLTDEERAGLIMHMFAGLPLENGFAENVNWDHFADQTRSASGDVLGKVYDEVYSRYLKEFEGHRPDGLRRLNSAAKELVLGGKTLTAEDKLSLFRDHGNGTVVTARGFQEIAGDVLTRREIKSAMDQQVKFYRDVELLMEEAFKGSI